MGCVHVKPTLILAPFSKGVALANRTDIETLFVILVRTWNDTLKTKKRNHADLCLHANSGYRDSRKTLCIGYAEYTHQMIHIRAKYDDVIWIYRTQGKFFSNGVFLIWNWHKKVYKLPTCSKTSSVSDLKQTAKVNTDEIPSHFKTQTFSHWEQTFSSFNLCLSCTDLSKLCGMLSHL